LRLVPKNLRNYLQTPTLIGCNFLTITEATCRLLRFALLRSAKPCSLTRFFKYRQTFFAFFNFFFASRIFRFKLLKLFSAEPSIMHCFFKPRQLSKTFFAFHFFFLATRTFQLKSLKLFPAKPSIMHCFFKPRQLSKTFFTTHNQHS